MTRRPGITRRCRPLSVGASCPVENLTVKDCHTKPPAHFTEGTLIAAMKQAAKWVTDPRLKAMLKETAGLGTEATRAGIIKTLLDRGFVEKRQRALRATQTGCALIDALPAPVKDPAMTALWEQALDDIAQRKGDAADFLARQTEWVRQLVARAGEGTGVAVAATPQHACPDCGKALASAQGQERLFLGLYRLSGLHDHLTRSARQARGGDTETAVGSVWLWRADRRITQGVVVPPMQGHGLEGDRG